MLRSLKLSHFRQHIDRSFEFGPGINAIRGENEAGKTTVLEAFTYLCFGATSLRESLEDVVTYHHPVSKLRVDGEIEHLGITYRAYRGKSGAEVNFGNEKVTGQREVTKHFEKLFGTTADMAGKLMFASQKSLAESLKAGPTAAGKMIEDLANFDLIDRVAEAIATRRQTGSTAGAEGRITALQNQRESLGVEAEDLAPLRAEVEAAQVLVAGSDVALTTLRAERDNLDIDQARQILRDAEMLDRTVQTTANDIDRVERALSVPVVTGPTDEELAAARAAVEAEKGYAKAAALHAELARTDTSEQWDNDLTSLEAEVVHVQGLEQAAGQRRAEAARAMSTINERLAADLRVSEVTIAQLEGRLIRETTCALCQKDLSDVPEVVRTNSDLQRQINEVKLQAVRASNDLRRDLALQTTARDDADTDMMAHQDYLAQLRAVITANAKVEQLYARAADYIEVDRSRVPGAWRWTGPAISEGKRPDVAGALATLEQQHRKATTDQAAREAQQSQLTQLRARREQALEARDSLPLVDAQETLEQVADLDAQITAEALLLACRQQALQKLQASLATKVALAEQAARQLAQTKTQLAAAEAELAAMQKYNALIKKVRAARPVITNKLWNIVLASVSKHFSDVRGQVSNITRGDGIFKCGGFPVSGLSGSAEDMLGLSMRIALTRTFLPGIDMLHLDEPAAACSGAREERMLGMLSTLGFGQTIIISHSDLTDSVADRIITV